MTADGREGFAVVACAVGALIVLWSWGLSRWMGSWWKNKKFIALPVERRAGGQEPGHYTGIPAPGKEGGSELAEREVEQLLVKRVQSIGGIAYKFVSPGHAGVPDRIIVMPGGDVAFVELKSKGLTERPLQVAEQERLKKLGAVVFSHVDSPERVEEVIRYLRRFSGGV